MTDAQREKSIADMGLLMTYAYQRFERTGASSARTEADGYRVAMERLIAARSPAQVRAMELAEGLTN